MTPELRDDVLALLRCPTCKGPLERDKEQLVCPTERIRYPVVNGVPWLTLEDRLRPRNR